MCKTREKYLDRFWEVYLDFVHFMTKPMCIEGKVTTLYEIVMKNE